MGKGKPDCVISADQLNLDHEYNYNYYANVEHDEHYIDNNDSTAIVHGKWNFWSWSCHNRTEWRNMLRYIT